jgi:hypothetical protein
MSNETKSEERSEETNYDDSEHFISGIIIECRVSVT